MLKQLLPLLRIQRAGSAAFVVNNTSMLSTIHCVLQRWWEQGLAWQHTTIAYMSLVAWMKKGLSTCTCGNGTSAATLALNLSLTGQPISLCMLYLQPCHHQGNRKIKRNRMLDGIAMLTWL